MQNEVVTFVNAWYGFESLRNGREENAKGGAGPCTSRAFGNATVVKELGPRNPTLNFMADLAAIEVPTS